MILKLEDQNCGRKLFLTIEFYIETIKHVWVYKNIFIHAESQSLSFHCLFLRKLLKDVFYQNKQLNQERGRHRIPQNRIQYRREAKRIPCAEAVPDLG